MNILFLVSSSGHYGIENMLVALARGLSSLGCRCVVGVFCDARAPHTEVAEEAHRVGLVVELINCGGRIDRTAVKHIRQLLEKHEIDVLHPHGYKADLYAYTAAVPNRVALLATSHNWPSRRWNMRAYAALDRLSLRRFDRVVAISDPIYSVLRRWGVPEERLALIGNGIDIERFENAEPTLRHELKTNETLVGFVGRLVADKGGSLLLRAARQVLNARPGTRFVLVGEGPCRNEWQRLASELGVAQNVVFTGNRNDMPGIYASLDLVALPSLVESLPMCLLEAMASSKPVIASEIGGIPSVIQSGQTGLLVRAGDVDGIARGILQLIAHPELARTLGQGACTHVRRHFSARSIAEAYLQQYKAILTSRSAILRGRSQADCAWQKQQTRTD